MEAPSQAAPSNTGVPPPLSAGTFSRALETDPHHGLCLVENSLNQRVYPTHVLRRSRSALSEMVGKFPPPTASPSPILATLDGLIGVVLEYASKYPQPRLEREHMFS